jgi:hypothetical protein
MIRACHCSQWSFGTMQAYNPPNLQFSMGGGDTKIEKPIVLAIGLNGAVYQGTNGGYR